MQQSLTNHYSLSNTHYFSVSHNLSLVCLNYFCISKCLLFCIIGEVYFKEKYRIVFGECRVGFLPGRKVFLPYHGQKYR